MRAVWVLTLAFPGTACSLAAWQVFLVVATGVDFLQRFGEFPLVNFSRFSRLQGRCTDHEEREKKYQKPQQAAPVKPGSGKYAFAGKIRNLRHSPQ